MEAKYYVLKLERSDIGQIIDALESRAEAYESTSQILRGHDEEASFIIEEVNDHSEADKIAEYFRAIIAKIERQIENI
jgi:hypothetical protein